MSVTLLDRRPQQYAHFPSEGYLFVRLANQDGEYGMAALAEHSDAVEVHLELSRWSPSVLRSLRADARWLRRFARQRGKSRIIGIRQEQGTPDPRWPKFTRLFGFTGQAVLQTAVAELD